MGEGEDNGDVENPAGQDAAPQEQKQGYKMDEASLLTFMGPQEGMDEDMLHMLRKVAGHLKVLFTEADTLNTGSLSYESARAIFRPLGASTEALDRLVPELKRQQHLFPDKGIEYDLFLEISIHVALRFNTSAGALLARAKAFEATQQREGRGLTEEEDALRRRPSAFRQLIPKSPRSSRPGSMVAGLKRRPTSLFSMLSKELLPTPTPIATPAVATQATYDFLQRGMPTPPIEITLQSPATVELQQGQQAAQALPRPGTQLQADVAAATSTTEPVPTPALAPAARKSRLLRGARSQSFAKRTGH